MLTELEQLPEGLLTREASRLHEVLSGPTLLHLPGRREAPLFVSVLLHGNEDTGWEAVRRLLARYQGATLPRALSVFIGNVAAAREGLRCLPGQPDYNRIWNGGDTPEHAMMARVLAAMAGRGVFASLDIHNNTGFNPHYACVNVLQPEFLNLATLFSRTVVYFIRPQGVQSAAFARLCPAVTVECGQPGQAHGVDHALEFIDACLHLAEVPTAGVPVHDIDLFHTVAVVKVAEDVAIGGDEAPLRLLPDVDRLNFQELPAGTPLAWSDAPGLPVQAWTEAGEDLAAHYFEVREGRLRTLRPVMPSMLTLDPAIIRQDCLCYLMERLDPGGLGAVREAAGR